MGISETKKQIVIDNYFKNTCDINTSIKEAFTKGFEVGLTKAVFPKDQYEARLKADLIAILTELQLEIEELPVHAVNNIGSIIRMEIAPSAEDVSEIIQHKIDKLKEENNERNEVCQETD